MSGRKPGQPLEYANLEIIDHFARREDWRLRPQVRAVIFRFAPGTHTTKANGAGAHTSPVEYSVHQDHR
jgi:hypothetical protein